MEPWYTVKLPIHSRPAEGKPSPLFVLEPRKATDGDMPEFKRVYDIHNLSGQVEIRGGHRHPPGGKREIIRCLHGSLRVELHHPKRCGVVNLMDPGTALVIGPDVWHEVSLSVGAVLLSCATTEFDVKESTPTACPARTATTAFDRSHGRFSFFRMRAMSSTVSQAQEAPKPVLSMSKGATGRGSFRNISMT